ncbi:MAG TPA: hypothetical protein VKH46_01075 [Thermoanaerobaculia bacterium]|jgi:hypothetical protein|nr:hypothetical protein [Thermoanaerobaculia bacterium]
MKTAAMLVCLLLAASAARAGEIYGTLSDEGKPVGAGTTLRLACGEAAVEAKTDAYGSYSLKVTATGKCALSVPSLPGAPSLPVTVYEKSARYDLAVGRSGGKVTLSRK